MENEKFKIKNGVLIAYTGTDEIIEIPDTVSVIGERVFEKKIAEKIIIPNSVKIIEKNAFRECGIGDIIMNDGVQIIGEYAFNHARCNTITFSENLREIRAHAFDFFLFYHLEIQKLELPKSIIKIGDYAFSGCEWLVPLPNSVSEIGEGAYWSTEMQEIKIPSKINIIPKNAFSGCNNLEKVVIENATLDILRYYDDYEKGIENIEKIEKIETEVSTTKIKNDAFSLCDNLKEVVFPNTLAEIGRNAFFGCTSLKMVHIITNEKVLNIEIDAFSDSGLEELYICYTNYLNIQYSAFYELTSLKKVKIVGSEYGSINIGSNAFGYCSELEEINIVTKGSVNIKDGAFKFCQKLKKINIIADSSINIGNNAFEYCDSLNTINISSPYIIKIDESSFYECTSLENINIEGSVSLVKNIRCTPEKIVNIIKQSEKIDFLLEDKKEYFESEKISDKKEIDKEKMEEILEKLDEINKSIKKLSDNKSDSTSSLDRYTVEDIIDGIWDIL